MLRNTAAAVSVLSMASVDGKGGRRAVAQGHWSGGQRAAPSCRSVIGNWCAAQCACYTLCYKCV